MTKCIVEQSLEHGFVEVIEHNADGTVAVTEYASIQEANRQGLCVRPITMSPLYNDGRVHRLNMADTDEKFIMTNGVLAGGYGLRVAIDDLWGYKVVHRKDNDGYKTAFIIPNDKRTRSLYEELVENVRTRLGVSLLDAKYIVVFCRIAKDIEKDCVHAKIAMHDAAELSLEEKINALYNRGYIK